MSSIIKMIGVGLTISMKYVCPAHHDCIGLLIPFVRLNDLMLVAYGHAGLITIEYVSIFGQIEAGNLFDIESALCIAPRCVGDL